MTAVQPPPLTPPPAPAWARVTSFRAGGGEGNSGGWGEQSSSHPPNLLPPLHYVPPDVGLAVRGEGVGGEAGGGSFRSLLAVPCLVSCLAAGWGPPAVVATGVCDVPAYPCPPQEYLLWMTVGPRALAGHILIWCTWAALVRRAWPLVALLLRAKGAAGSPPTPGRVVYDSTRRIE